MGHLPRESLAPQNEVNCLMSHATGLISGTEGILEYLPPKPVPSPPGHTAVPGRGEVRRSGDLRSAG